MVEPEGMGIERISRSPISTAMLDGAVKAVDFDAVPRRGAGPATLERTSTAERRRPEGSRVPQGA